jgi:hypothetical protein
MLYVVIESLFIGAMNVICRKTKKTLETFKPL